MNDPALVEINVSDYSSTLRNDGNMSGGNIAGGSHSGIYIQNSLSGYVVNANMLTIASPETSNDFLRGIQTGSNSGVIENSGDISIDLTGSTQGRVIGIDSTDTSGMVSNSGTIGVSVDALSATATGIETGVISGIFENSGQISANASGDSVTAYGAVMFFLTGSASNSGTITVSATASSEASAAGIRVIGPVTGSLTNSGTVTVDAFAGTNPNVTGLDISMTDTTGTVANSGTITVTAMGSGSTASSGFASGISSFITSGSLSNSGSINASVDGVYYGSAAGIWVNSLTTGGMLSNSGTIAAKSVAVTTASAFGLALSTIDGSVSNSGTIAVSAQASTAFAMGILGNSVGTGSSIQNSGTISAAGTGTSSLTIRGIEVQTLSGSINNSGAIQVTATGQSGGLATGIAFNTVDTNGTVTNSGTIDVTAHFENAEGFYAAGIGGGPFDGTLVNSGSIDVRSTAVPATSASNANIYGIAAYSVSNSIIHSGTITVESAGGTNSQAYGIFVDTLPGQVDVSGDIAVSGAETNYGIYLGSGGGTLNIDSTADINGTIRVLDHNVNLTHVGEAAVYRFEDADTATGTFTTRVAVPNGAWFSQGAGGAAPVYAAVSGSDFDVNTLVPFQIGELNDALTGRLRAIGSANRFDRAAFAFNGAPETRGEFSPYVNAAYSRARQGATSSASSADSNLNSLNAGVTHDLGGGTRYGVGISYAKGIATQSPNTLDTTGGLLSGVLSQKLGFVDLSAGLGAGWFSHKNHRQIASSSDAIGNFSSTVVTGQVGISTDIGLPGNVILTPEALFRLGQQRFGGYTETGSDANATVAGRDVTFSQVNIGATLAAQIGPGILSASAAAVRRDVDGPSTVDVSIFGTGATLASDVGRSETFGEFTLGYDQPVGGSGMLSMKAQAGIGQDSMTQSFSAYYKLAF
eukprot:g2342.t1